MSFFTSLTGLNAATAQLGVTSNNIANAGTTGFKRSRAEFGDIFSSSPLQRASSVVGQGSIIKNISQEFSQGNIEFSQNTLDLAISGQGFFALKPDFTSVQTVYTRNGSFSLNSDRYVVDGSNQYLMSFPVNDDGSVVSTARESAQELRIPDTSGLPRATSEINLGLNLPAAAEVIPQREIFTSGQAEYVFDPDDPDTYNTSTSITVFDSLGNPSIATIYYAKTQSATPADPRNKWQAYLFVGGEELEPALISVKNDRDQQVFINEFGQLVTDPRVGDPRAVPPIEGDPGFIPGVAHPKYVLDDQDISLRSQPARVQTPPIIGDFTFGSTGDEKQFVGAVDPDTGFPKPNSLPSQNLFRMSVDGSNTRMISISPALLETIPLDANGERRLDGVQLANLMTTAINREFGDERFFDLGNDNRFRVSAFTPDDDDVLQPISNFQNIDIELPPRRTTITVPDVGVLNRNIDDTTDHLLTSTLEINETVITGPFTTDASPRPSLLALRDAINEVTATTGVRAFLNFDVLELRAVRTFNADGTVDKDFDGEITLEGSIGLAMARAAGLERTSDDDQPEEFAPATAEDVRYTPELIQSYAQEQLDFFNNPDGTVGVPLNVRYDVATRGLSFKPNETPEGFEIQGLTVQGLDSGGGAAANPLLGLGASDARVRVGQDPREPDFRGRELVPNGRLALPTSQQRVGIEVEYLRESQRFQFSSGTTGIDSRIALEGSDLNPQSRDLFVTDNLELAGEGLSSIAAQTVSGQPARNISGSFLVSQLDNQVSVSVDGISGLVTLPPGPYTGETFARALEARINLIEDQNGRKVSGVRVTYDVVTERFTFTSGTATDNSFVSVNGHPNWGLANTTAERGRVPVFANLVQDVDELGRPIFIDRDGNETPDGVVAANQNWFPVYLRKGELTFDTQGSLISPKEGALYDPFDPRNGADPIVLNVDYGRNSTQLNAPFSLLSLSQDGFPSGKLDGLEVDPTGVVRATYTNGQQLALGKVMLANFPNPNGLKQVGDASYLTTASSGEAVIGQAGGEGFGSIQGGARERSNVDLTQELVDLITAQRNFQANAKAIETSNTLTQTITNIR